MKDEERSPSSAENNGSPGQIRFYSRLLLLFFLVSLVFVNPIVHGDGVGYYAFARALLIQHNLRFEQDYLRGIAFAANPDNPAPDELSPEMYTKTGHLNNFLAPGSAFLWLPFLSATHAIVLLAKHLGISVAANGFSRPYVLTMALATAFYGFLSLRLSYRLACVYVHPRWAFLATLGVWTATSLPVYMYFNPAWSHALSAFAVTLFFVYWHETHGQRTPRQWALLGLAGALMTSVYYPNAVFLLLPLVEYLMTAYPKLRARAWIAAGKQAAQAGILPLTLLLGLLPVLIMKQAIFGNIFSFGNYTRYTWDFSVPHRWQVLFASEHGLLSWTPIVFFCVVGLACAPAAARRLSCYAGLACLAFYFVIGSYPYWHGMASFGNRFFISLTPVFILGLAFLLSRLAGLFRSPARCFPASALVLSVFAVWNAGFIYQWGAHLIPPRGPISWPEMAHNQFFVVPGRVGQDLRRYLFDRGDFMRLIQRKDTEQLQAPSPPVP